MSLDGFSSRRSGGPFLALAASRVPLAVPGVVQVEHTPAALHECGQIGQRLNRRLATGIGPAHSAAGGNRERVSRERWDSASRDARFASHLDASA